MGYSRVLGAPQTGSISMHFLLSFSPNPIWWDVILPKVYVKKMMKRITGKIKLGCDKNN
jgi:hypothetical protein